MKRQHIGYPPETGEFNFTLIELLIVIAVIAILVSILLPALASAKKKAQAITCTGNKKQIGTIIAAYGNDFSGWSPEGRSSQYIYPRDYWTHHLQELKYLSWQKTRRSSILVCPSVKPYVYVNQIKCVSLRGALSGPLVKTTFFRSGGQVQDTGNADAGVAPRTYPLPPSRFLIVFDSFATTDPNYKSNVAFANPDSASAGHNGKISVLMFDGHAEMGLKSFSYLSYAAVNEDPVGANRLKLQ